LKKQSADNLDTSPGFEQPKPAETGPANFVPQNPQPQPAFVPKKNQGGGPIREHDFISQTSNYNAEHERNQKAVYVAKKNSPVRNSKEEGPGRRISQGNAAPVYVEKKYSFQGH